MNKINFHDGILSMYWKTLKRCRREIPRKRTLGRPSFWKKRPPLCLLFTLSPVSLFSVALRLWRLRDDTMSQISVKLQKWKRRSQDGINDKANIVFSPTYSLYIWNWLSWIWNLLLHFPKVFYGVGFTFFRWCCWITVISFGIRKWLGIKKIKSDSQGDEMWFKIFLSIMLYDLYP